MFLEGIKVQKKKFIRVFSAYSGLTLMLKNNKNRIIFFWKSDCTESDEITFQVKKQKKSERKKRKKARRKPKKFRSWEQQNNAPKISGGGWKRADSGGEIKQKSQLKTRKNCGFRGVKVWVFIEKILTNYERNL